jgi:integrase
MSITKIRRKKGTIYRAKVSISGGRVVSRCFTRKIDAITYRDKTKSNPFLSTQERIRFDAFVKIFIDLCAKPNLEASSVKRYESAINSYFLPRFARFYLKDITKEELFKFKAEVMEMKFSASQKNFLICTLKTIFRRAVELDYLERSPASGLTAPKKSLSKTEYWSKDEIKKFLAFAESTPRLPLYMLALNTGMRLGELFALMWDCLDFDNGLLTVRRSWCQKTSQVKQSTKTNLLRTFPVNRNLLRYLAELKLKAISPRVLDSSVIGFKNPAHASRILGADAKKAGVKVIRFHDIRHTFATQFVANGGSIHAIAHVLGHTSTTMTDRYAHFGLEHAAQIANIVSFSPPATGNIISFNGHNLDTKGVGGMALHQKRGTSVDLLKCF